MNKNENNENQVSYFGRVSFNQLTLYLYRLLGSASVTAVLFLVM